jgi:putative hydrolase of the HAD superfamily
MTVRAVVFDYFGTLTPSVLAITTPEEQATLGALLGVDPGELETAWQGMFMERSTGRSGDLPTTLRTVAGRIGGTPSDENVAEAARIRTAAYRRSAVPRRDAVEVLSALRERGLRIAVVSDCTLELVTMWPDLPVSTVVEQTVFSALVGKRKPDPEMYRLACERLGVEAGECVYVGDGGSNELTGAKAFGMRAVLLADEQWSVGHRYDADDWHGEKINALAEVPTLLA